MVILGNDYKMSAAEQPADAIHVDEIDHFNDDWTPPFAFRDGVKIRTDQKITDFYTIYEEIGEGKFGKVFRCVEKETGLTLAAKFIKLRKDADLAKVEKEVQIMTKMRHKCIAQIYDAFAGANNDVILVMEIVAGGELFDRVIEEYYVLTETAVALIMYQICEALGYIHTQNIIHLDLKPENIMCVSQSGNQIKLIDFGLAQYYDGSHDLLLMAGTPEFAAPEVIKYEPLDFHTDMWSVGVIAYILLSGESPFLGDNIAETYCNVEKGKYVFCEQFDENGISDEARDFIRKLLVMNKAERMLPHECLQHVWITRSLEKSREMAHRKSQEEMEKRLNTQKLKSYVRKKQFRKAVFTVLFVNQAMRLMNTLKERRSEAGVKYVQNMLDVAQATQQEAKNDMSSLVKNAFKRKPEVKMAVEEVAMKPSTSEDKLATGVMDVDRVEPKSDLLEISVVSTDNETSRPSSPKPAKRHRDKGDKPKRVKSTSRKASSSEQAAKKPKKGSLGALLKPPEAGEATSEDVDMKSRSPSPKSPVLERKNMEKVENKLKEVDIKLKIDGITGRNDGNKAGYDGKNVDGKGRHDGGAAKVDDKASEAKTKKENLLSRLPFKEDTSSVPFTLPVAAATVKKEAPEASTIKKEPLETSTANKKAPEVVTVKKDSPEVVTPKEEGFVMKASEGLLGKKETPESSTMKKTEATLPQKPVAPFSLPVAASTPFSLPVAASTPFTLPVAAATPKKDAESKRPLTTTTSTPLNGPATTSEPTTTKKPLSKTKSAADPDAKSPKLKKKKIRPKNSTSTDTKTSEAKLDLRPDSKLSSTLTLNSNSDVKFDVKSLLKPVEHKIQKPAEVSKPSEIQKSIDGAGEGTSKVGSLLKRLQQNQTSDAPMMMAVSSFVPSKPETAKNDHEGLKLSKSTPEGIKNDHDALKFSKSDPGSAKLGLFKPKVIKIEQENDRNGELLNKIGNNTKILSPELVSKTVSEKKVTVRKKKIQKTKESGDPTQSESESTKKQSAQVQLQHKILSETLSSKDNHINVATKKLQLHERDKSTVNQKSTTVEQEKVLDSREELELIRQKLRKKDQVAVQKRDSVAAKMEIKTENGILVEAKGVGERKKSLKAKLSNGGKVEEVKVNGGDKLYALLGQKAQQNNQGVKPEATSKPMTFSEQLAANLEARKKERKQNQSKQGSHSTFEFDENDDTLLRQQQDAFDFSLLKAKLEQRLAGNASDSMDEQAYLDNQQQKQEAIKALKSRLTDTGNVQRAKKKWFTMEKSLYDESL